MDKSIVKVVKRSMQPVVELQMANGTYTYGVRAPRAGGVVPPVSYRDVGFDSLASCLLNAARGLGSDFPRIYVRLQGHCVGECDTVEIRRRPAEIAAALEENLRTALHLQRASRESAIAEIDD